jgi:hypothetical protein
VTLSIFIRQVDQWFEELFGEVEKLPDPYSVKLYPYVQNVYMGWTAFSAAVKEKSNHIVQEIWKLKKGSRVKGLHEVQVEYAALREQRKNLLKNSGRGTRAFVIKHLVGK